MTEIGYAALGIIPSFDGFQGKLEQGTAKSMAAAGQSGGSKFGKSAGQSAGKAFGGTFKKVAGALTAGYAALKVKDFLSDSIAEARESQKVGALTERVIESTGSAAKVTAKHVGDLAGAISAKTGIDDEAIQRGANMLLTFKAIRNEAGKGNKIFDRTTKVVTDMAAAMAGGSGGEIDMKAASIQVGKALGDPVKGVTALAKVGVTFTKQQRAQIKALVEGGDANAAMALNLIDSTTTYNNLLKQNKGDVAATAKVLTEDLTPAQQKAFDMYAKGGHTLEAQKRVLKELNSEFGGAAAAQATMGDKAKVAWGNIKEGIGTALLPLVDDVEKAFLDKGVPAAQKFTDWFQKEGVPAIRDFADEAKPIVKSALPAIGTALDKAKDAAKVIGPALKGAFDGFNKLPDWVQSTIVLGTGAAALGSKLGVGKLLGSKGGGLGGGSGLLGLASKAKPIPVFVVNNMPGEPGVPGGKPKGGPKGLMPWLTAAINVGGAAMTAGTYFQAKDMQAAAKNFVPGKYDPKKLGVLDKISQQSAGGGGKNLGEDVYKLDASLAGLADKHYGDAYKALLEMQKKTGLSARELATLLPITNKRMGELATGTKDAADKTDHLRRNMVELPSKKDVNFRANGLDVALSKVQQYGSMLDGLNGKTVHTFIKVTTDKVAGQLGTTDSGEGAANRPARAAGGPVAKGRAYLVGERRPELFVPAGNGRIEPRVTAGKSSGGNTYNVTVVADDPYKWKRDMDHMQRAGALGAVDFR